MLYSLNKRIKNLKNVFCLLSMVSASISVLTGFDPEHGNHHLIFVRRIPVLHLSTSEEEPRDDVFPQQFLTMCLPE
jgi:hypothetical protein